MDETDKSIVQALRRGEEIINKSFHANRSKWIPIRNKKITTKPQRHHTAICPVCLKRFKNIMYHYKIHHRIWFEDHFQKPLYKGEVGELYGVRFITTKKPGRIRV